MRHAAPLAVALLAACADVPEPGTPTASTGEPTLMVWADLTERPRPEPDGTVEFEDGGVAADYWLPKGPGPHPVVLMVHGGCWQKAIADRTLMDWASADLRERGYAVWNVEYPGVDEPDGAYPIIFQGVRSSASLLLAEAEALDLDLDRVVALGHSAGGHLALWLAGSDELPEGSAIGSGFGVPLRGVVSTGGLQDLEAAEPVTLRSCLAAVRGALTGPVTAERPDPYADTSPARLLPLGVPQVALHAEDDRIAPPSLGEAWVEEAEAAGDDATLVVVPGGHVELITPGTEAWQETTAQIERLLARP